MQKVVNSWSHSSSAYLYIIPALVVYTLFLFFPFINTIYLSIMNKAGSAFIGVKNYNLLLKDPIFWSSFLNNVIWMILSLILPMGIGLFLAAILRERRVVGRGIFRAIYFLPQVVSSVVVAMAWRWMFHPIFGPINHLLKVIGLGHLSRGWLGDPNFALLALIIANTWWYYGFCMVIFLAALQGLDETLFDAAKIDGANRVQQFFYITLPNIRHTMTVILLITIINSFKVFDLVYIATSGGPGFRTYVMSYYLYQYSFRQWRINLGAAAAVIQTGIIFLFTITFLIYRRKAEESVQ